MSIQSAMHAIQSIDFMVDMRESALAYPIILSTHLSMIAAFGGMILMTDLRLMGVALKNYTVTDVVKGLRPWKHAGLTIMLAAGLMLGGSEADKYYPNPYFWTKMTLLITAAVHAIVFRGSVYKNTEALDRATTLPAAAKVAGFTSILIWAGIACMGRLIAYYEPPK
jgi:hypothetical protein